MRPMPRARLEHLPLDILGLSPLAVRAVAAGMDFDLAPVVRRVADVPLVDERLDTKARDELAGLFGLDGASTQAPAAPDAQALEDAKQRESDRASEELRRLFGLDKD